MADQKNSTLPADATLTSNNFSLNSDGTVTIKNSELSKLLQDKLKGAVADPSVNAVNIGITIGT